MGSQFNFNPMIKTQSKSIINVGINAALNNSGVMRHGLNANYYLNQNKPIIAIREGGAAVLDMITGSRK